MGQALTANFIATLIIESYGMSLECHDIWCHLSTSFLIENDVKILWKCHDIWMEFNRIFMRKRHPIPVKCHENVMKFQCHSIGLKFFVHFDGIFMETVHGIVMEFDVIFDQNSDGNQWWHFIMRVVLISGLFLLIVTVFLSRLAPLAPYATIRYESIIDTE